MTHPSFFALEAHVSRADASTAAHVEACEQCRAHLASVRAPLPLPAALRSLPAAARKKWWPAFFAVPVGLAAAVGFTLLVRAPVVDATTAKGTPAVDLWLHRDDRATRWSGEPVEAGDAIRFEVAGAGFEHLVVFDERTNAVIYEARLLTPGSTLTPTWQLDDDGSAEVLQVVLDQDVSGTSSTQPACELTQARWCRRFILNRRTP